jgi:hypothetical protein
MGEQDYEKGVATLYEMELNASDQQITELEEDFLEAVQIIYQPQKTKLENIQTIMRCPHFMLFLYWVQFLKEEMIEFMGKVLK